MILLAHPFGNANVRAILSALDQAGLLAKFVTALGWSNASPLVHELPPNLRSQMARRGYELPHYKIKIFPTREVVRLLGSGSSTREVAERLYVSARTVEGHVYRAMTKTGVETREELFRLLYPDR